MKRHFDNDDSKVTQISCLVKGIWGGGGWVLICRSANWKIGGFTDFKAQRIGVYTFCRYSIIR